MEKLEVMGRWSRTEGGFVDPKGKMAAGQLGQKHRERKVKS